MRGQGWYGYLCHKYCAVLFVIILSLSLSIMMADQIIKFYSGVQCGS